MKTVDEEVVTQIFYLSAVVSIQIVIVFSSTTKIHIATAAYGCSGARSNIQNTTEAIAVFRCEPTSHEIYCLKYLRADAWAELWLSIIEKRDPIDKFM